MNVETRLLDLSCQGRRKILVLEGGGGGYDDFFPKSFLGLKKYSRNTVKKIRFEKKLFCFEIDDIQ